MSSSLVSQTDDDSSLNASLAFFEQAHHAFLDAERAVQAHSLERFFCIGDLVVCLRFAGAALESSITPALEHQRIPAHPHPDLTVCLWDSESTGTPMPSPPWSLNDFGVRNEIRGYNNERVRAAFHMGSGVLSLLDAERNLAVFWIRDASELPIYESGAPLLTILHWWMRARGRQLLHAAAIGNEAGGVLLVGKGGSGKSSTALRALHSDRLQYAGDDYCLASHYDQPCVHSLYSSGKIHTKDTAKFPFLLPELDQSYNLNNEKALFFLKDAFSAKLTKGFPIRAILCPVVTGRETTTLREISSSACLLAIAPSTIFQLPGAGKQDFEFLSKLVRAVPSYSLELGSNFSELADVIADFLQQR